MRRIFFLIILFTGFAYLWTYFEEIPLFVIGQPTRTGKIQASMEEPFFKNLRSKTKIPFVTTYQPIDFTGYKDTFQLNILKDQQVDLISLRFPQNSAWEPSLVGIDLVGMIDDYKSAKEVISAYSGTIDKYLNEKFDAKLLGIWTFGPQELFCNQPIQGLSALKGRKVRVSSQVQSQFISALGAQPTIISFEDTLNSLRDEVVDCAITSGASANFAGWPQYAQYNFPAKIQFGLNGYVISLQKWNQLSSSQKSRLQKAFDDYLEELWKYTEILQLDMAKCNRGEVCKLGTRYQGSSSSVSQADKVLMRELLKNKILPQWKIECDKVHVDCGKTWDAKLSGYLARIMDNAVIE